MFVTSHAAMVGKQLYRICTVPKVGETTMSYLGHLLNKAQLDALTPEERREFLRRILESPEHYSLDFHTELRDVLRKHLQKPAEEIYGEMKPGSPRQQTPP